ncbi:MAG TPA: 50S ribosomal protein L33 [Polyangiaceae bacterium]|nr:50S ribosomal protein L33 [Polyangiaceae bacterium]
MRVNVSLACSVCGSRNYRTTRAQRPGAPPLVLKKFCRTCNQHTPHRETK